MEKKNIVHKAWKIILGVVFLCLMVFITVIVFRQPAKPLSNAKVEIPHSTNCPIFADNESNSEEKRVARHFAVDTLPGLMQKGLIHNYQRNALGTYLSVNGKLWKCRSLFFKQSLLREVFVFNKVNGYGLSTRIIDSTSGKLYARISSSAKMDFYD
ncbi:MAG: hypothetical protein ABSA44_11540 [Bacteroidota bacterium]|jgi:hypothetical protein